MGLAAHNARRRAMAKKAAKETAPERQTEASKPLTVPQIKEALAAEGIEIPIGVTKRDDLLALLDAADDQGTGEGA